MEKGKRELSYTGGGNVNWCNHFGANALENSMEVP